MRGGLNEGRTIRAFAFLPPAHNRSFATRKIPLETRVHIEMMRQNPLEHERRELDSH